MNNQTPSGCCAIARWLLTLLIVAASFSAVAQNSAPACGELRSHYGPFDYRTNRGETLNVVERFHFTPEVEALVRGKSSMHIGQDLSYTLGTFPNHHRALRSMMLYGKKLKTPQPPHVKYSVECFFERALRFRPDDTTVRMMYASFLVDNARAAEATRELEQVAQAVPDEPFTHYNLGLIYLDMKEYEKALAQAHKAMALGFGRTALPEKLEAAGKWRAPEEPLTAPAGSGNDTPTPAK